MIEIDIVATIVAVIASISALIMAWKKAPYETRALDVESDTRVSDVALKLIEPLQKRIDELEAARERDKMRITEHERRISELECELRSERSDKAEVVEGANRLVHQIESLGAQPVYRPPKRGTGELKQP